MLKITKKILFCGLLLTLSSCLFIDPMPRDWDWGLKPRPLTGTKNFPSAKTEYGKGFRDGCVSAFNAVSKGLTSDMDPRLNFRRMQKSSDYGTGWFDGVEQCTYIIDWDVP